MKVFTGRMLQAAGRQVDDALLHVPAARALRVGAQEGAFEWLQSDVKASDVAAEQARVLPPTSAPTSWTPLASWTPSASSAHPVKSSNCKHLGAGEIISSTDSTWTTKHLNLRACGDHMNATQFYALDKGSIRPRMWSII